MTDGGIDENKRATLRRFAALGATASLGLTGTAAADNGESQNDVRSAITGYLAATPGAHFSKIRDDLQLGTGETQYHLRELVDTGRIETEKDGEYRRYFPADQFTEFERTALGSLRRETPRQLLLALLETPGLSGRQLADRLDVSSATISKHTSNLAEVDVIKRTDGYHVRHPETIIVLIVRYSDSFDDQTMAFAHRAESLINHQP